MTKQKSTKRMLLSSVLSLVLCVSMLIGTTFAWFTDTATSKNNKIVAGNLDVQLLMHNGTEYADISNTEASIFGASNSVIAQNNNTNTLWEPGKTQVAYLAIRNNGNLALKYQVTLTVKNPEGGKNLYEAMEFVITPDAQNGAVTSWDGTGAQTPVLGTQVVSNGEGQLQKEETHYFALSVHMKEEAGNEYQGGQIDFDLTVVATQLTAESDSFGPQYDEKAEYPVWLGEIDSEWEGTGTVDDPYLLGSEAELAALAQAVNGTTKTRATANSFDGQYFKLTADVDLQNLNWTPIGTSDTPFKGNFDGQGHTISNLLCSASGTSNMGLFGFTTDGKGGSEIKNFTVNNATVEGRLCVGVVAGTPYTTKYDNIKLTGDIKVNGMSYVGGVLGKNAYDNVTNITINANEGSYVKANSVENGTAYRTYVGGVIGFMGEGGHKVENVTSNIDVIGSTCDVGGIAGIAHYGNSFINCTSSGDVTITDASTDKDDYLEIGGIAGVWNNGGSEVTFSNCSYTGTLSTPEVIVFPNSGLVGKAYSASGTGVLNIDGKRYMASDGTDYKVVDVANRDELASALDGVENATIIRLTADIAGDDVTVNQPGDENGNIIIDGLNHKYDGTIKIKGNSDFNGAEDDSLVIKNINFETSTKSRDFIWSADSSNGSFWRYAHNVTIENCTFTASGEAVHTAVGVRFQQAYNIEVVNCKATNMHTILQTESCGSTVTVSGCQVVNGKNGVSFNNTMNAVIKDTKIQSAGAGGYGVRHKGEVDSYALTVENCQVDAFVPVLIRNMTGTGYTATFNGTNTLVATNKFGYQVVVSAGDWDNDAAQPSAPTGKFTLTGVDSFTIFK